MGTSENAGSAPARSGVDGPDVDDAAVADDVQILSALANDTRYELLRTISAADGAVCVCELPPALGVSQSTASRALSRLDAAGLLKRRKEGRWRYYDMTPRGETIVRTLDEIRAEGSP